MAAPVGNKFWMLRSKHGRDRIIKDPEALWESACEYFQYCIDNPLIEIDYKGKDAERVELPHTRPFTKQGLLIFCDISEWRLIEDLKGVSNDFSQIVTRIEQIIYEHKFAGAATGFYNPSIIAQDLGLNVQKVVLTDARKTIDELFPSEDDFNEADQSKS